MDKFKLNEKVWFSAYLDIIYIPGKIVSIQEGIFGKRYFVKLKNKRTIECSEFYIKKRIKKGRK